MAPVKSGHIFCTKCPMEFTRQGWFTKHMKNVHSVSKDKVNEVSEKETTNSVEELVSTEVSDNVEVTPMVEETVEITPMVIIDNSDAEISEVCETMAAIAEMVDNPSQMFGSCNDCEYISLNDTDLKTHRRKHIEYFEECTLCGGAFHSIEGLSKHIETDHTVLEALRSKEVTVKKLLDTMRKAAKEKKSMKSDNTKLEQELIASRKENDVKTKQIAKLMVDISTKEELLKVQNTTTKSKEKIKISETPIEFVCNHCNYIGKNKQEVDGHFKFEHLKCLKCQENFMTVGQLKGHMAKEHADSIWHKKKNCELCKKSFSNWTLYEVHIKKHQCLRFTCTVCKAEFTTKAAGLEHKIECDKEKTFSCHECNFKAPVESDISKHLDEVHLAGFETITNMENSIKGKTTDDTCFCPLCDFKAQTEEAVIKHLEETHELKDTTNEPKTNKSVNKSSNITCKNGESCRFLKENRCHYYHKVAAQPEEPWKEVVSRRKRFEKQQGQTSGVLRPSVGLSGVKNCRDWDKCDRGRRCKFQHYEKNFSSGPPKRRQ